MTTATEMVSWALGLIRVVSPAETLTDYQYLQGVRALNAMLRRWEANGIALGWSAPEAPESVLAIPEEAEEVVATNLAMRVRVLFGATLDEDLKALAKQGLRDLQNDVYTAMPPIQIVSQPRPSSWWCRGYNITTGGPTY